MRADHTGESLCMARSFIETIIKRNMLRYTIRFMLWRYSQYDYFSIHMGLSHHPTLGHLMRKQQSIRISLPDQQKLLKDYSDKIQGGTEELTEDEPYHPLYLP